MTIDTRHHDAARVLLELLPSDRIQLIQDTETTKLMGDELAKRHALRPDKFSPDELKDFRSHLLDGGGVLDDRNLWRQFMQAMLDEDWPTFFRHLPHVIKAELLRRGITQPGCPGQITGHGPTVPQTVLEDVHRVLSKFQ